MNNNLRIFLRFSDDITSLTPKNNLGIFFGLKPEKFNNNKVQQNFNILTKECVAFEIESTSLATLTKVNVPKI